MLPSTGGLRLERLGGPGSSSAPHTSIPRSPSRRAGCPNNRQAGRRDQRVPHFGLTTAFPPNPARPAPPSSLPSTSKTRSVTRATIILQTRVADAYPINYKRSSHSSHSSVCGLHSQVWCLQVKGCSSFHTTFREFHTYARPGGLENRFWKFFHPIRKISIVLKWAYSVQFHNSRRNHICGGRERGGGNI